MLSGGLSAEQYEAELQSLRLTGPMGEVKTPNGFLLPYRGPDRRTYFIRPAASLSALERQTEVEQLRKEILKSVQFGQDIRITPTKLAD